MVISQAAARGFALAATLASDRGAERASSGLSEATRNAWRREAVTLSTCSRTERARHLARWTRRAGPIAKLPPAAERLGLSPRALALLATCGRPMSDAQASDGPGWSAQAPSPRPGFEAEAGLLRVLRQRLCQAEEQVAAPTGSQTGASAGDAD